jgi:hypothetical protein
VFAVTNLSIPLATATTSADGRFKVEFDPGDNLPDNAMLVVRVSEGLDMDANDDGVPDATPTVNKGSLHAVASKALLDKGIVNVTLLSDAVFRLLGESPKSFTDQELAAELHRLTGILLNSADASTTGDINGDGAISYADVLAFLPHKSDHKARLVYDFARFQRPIDPNVSSQSVINKFHAGDTDVGDAVRSLFSDVSYQKQFVQEADKPHVEIGVSATGQGEITSPALDLPQTGGMKEVVLRKDRSAAQSLTFTASATDSDWMFHSWIGCTSVAGNVCTVSQSESTKIKARFGYKQATILSSIPSFVEASPLAGMTSISIEGASIKYITKDAGLITKLQAAVVGSVLTTGLVDMPMAKVTSVVSRTTNSGVFTAVFGFVEAKPLEVYEKVSAFADATPFTLDDIRAVSVGSDIRTVSGNPIGSAIAQPKPPVDLSGTITGTGSGGGGGNNPSSSWYVTRDADSTRCKGYASTDQLLSVLSDAWNANPKGFPFNNSTLQSTCSAMVLGFIAYGSLSDYADGKSAGEVDLAQGGSSGTTLTASASRWISPSRIPTHREVVMAQAANPAKKLTNTDKVWLVGHGSAYNLGEGVFLTGRKDGKPGMQMLVMRDTRKATNKEAYTAAQKQCGLTGHADSCALVQAMTSDAIGLTKVGVGLPIIKEPIELSFGGTTTVRGRQIPWTGKLAFGLDIDLVPKTSMSLNLLRAEYHFEGGADLRINPNLRVDFGIGGTYTAGQQDGKRWTTKYKKSSSTATDAETAKANMKKVLVKVDVSKFMGGASLVLKSSFDINFGIDASGNVTVFLNPGFEHTTKWNATARRACYTEWKKVGFIPYPSTRCESNAESDGVSTNSPYLKAGITGELSLKPFIEFALVTGVREVMDETAKVFIRPYASVTGLAETGVTWSKVGFCFNQPKVSAYAGIGAEVGSSLSSDQWPAVLKSLVPLNKEWIFLKAEWKLFEFPPEDNPALTQLTCGSDGEPIPKPPPPPPLCQAYFEGVLPIWNIDGAKSMTQELRRIGKCTGDAEWKGGFAFVIGRSGMLEHNWIPATGKF